MKRNIRKSIKPIIGSLLISITLWFMVTTSKEYTTQITIPLEVSRLAKGKTLLEPVASEVTLEIRGTGQSIIAFYLYESGFKLELPDISKNTTINLADHLVFLDLPSRLNFELIEILEPKSLELKIDDFIETQKPVQFSGLVGTEPGYIVLDTTFSSDSVNITGPKSILDTIKYIYTENGKYKNQKYPFNNQLKLNSPRPELVNLNPSSIDVQFEIQKIIERWIYEIPVKIKKVPPHLIVESTPPVFSLKIKGGEQNVEKITNEDIQAEIDFSTQYNPEQPDYPVSIKTPLEISWLESSPKTFKLTVKRK